jgi:hypothetical protein
MKKNKNISEQAWLFGKAVVVAGLTAVLTTSAAMAADLGGSKDYAEPAPAKVSTWEMGGRYFYSSGKHRYEIYQPGGEAYAGMPLSALTYDNLDAHAGEFFFRGDWRGGMFVKGYVGGGVVSSGKLTDEDFTPFIDAYSNTSSSQKDGSITYVNIDLGYNFVDTTRSSGLKDGPAGTGFKLGGFVGYHYWNESLNAYGCSQNATAPNCAGSNAISSSVLAITEDVVWNSFRLGVSTEVQINNRLKLSAEAAYLLSELGSSDTHHLRTDRAAPSDETGSGQGYQLGAVLSYELVNGFAVGVGGRYWHIESSDATQTQYSTGGGSAAIPQKYESDRYGMFVQGSMKF